MLDNRLKGCYNIIKKKEREVHIMNRLWKVTTNKDNTYYIVAATDYIAKGLARAFYLENNEWIVKVERP
jgi:hypothetical protein